MSKFFRLIYIISIVWFFITGCESDLQLKLNEGGGKLVLYAFPTADSILSVHLSKSINQSSVDYFERIYDGYITIYKNGTRVDSFTWPYKETWQQRPAISIKSNDYIKIVGGNTEGLLVEGETTLPETIPINKIIKLDTISTKDGGYILYNINFSDPKDIENYYQLIISSETRDSTNKKIESQQINYIKTDDVFYIRNQEGSLLGGIDFLGTFSDYLITSENYNLKIGIPEIYLEKPDEKQKRIIRFNLMSLSEDYYKYIRSRVVAEYNYDLPLVDPIKPHTNINGGLGLVGGIAIASDSIIIIGSNYN